MVKLDKIFRDEDGFSTLSVVVALLISLSLIFSTAQVYRISSCSAEIQNVADAGALAAENEVAEFMIAVRVVDSVVLSLSLTGIVVAGVGVVALCTPVTASASAKLLETSEKILEARDKFAETASNGLNKLQTLLPFLSAVKTYQVAAKNNGGVMDANYLAISLLMPGEGVSIEPGNINDVKAVKNDINNQADDMRQAAQQAEEAAKKANKAKTKAFMADTGNNPGYCMEDRARDLAYVPEYYNPHYNSVDTWDFGVALRRAQSYYAYRWQNDTPTGSSPEKYADYYLRRHFYVYAYEEMKKGYVNQVGDSFDCYFPHLPCKLDEMKDTRLFTETYFPVTSEQDTLVMHAYKGCPRCTNIASWNTAQDWMNSSAGYSVCPSCEFSANHFGSVASASTNSISGFEHWYKIVEEASKDYKQAKDEAAPANAKVKEKAADWINRLKDLISNVANKRIYVKPPGSYGAICMIVNTSTTAASKGFESSFVSNEYSIGARLAVSGATIIEEQSTETGSVVASITDGLANNAPGVSGVLGVAFEAWHKLLSAFSSGQNSLIAGLESLLNSFSFNSASGLGTWAANKISSVFQTVGLEPANLNALKPVIVNTGYIASKTANESATSTSGKTSKKFATKYMSIRSAALKTEDMANSILTGIADANEIKTMLDLQAAGNPSGSFEIAKITPLGDWGPEIPITIALPKEAASTISSLINFATNAIMSIVNAVSGGKVWR